MSLIKVTAEDLQTLSSQVMAGSESIQEQLSRLQSEVTAVVGGDWMGVASGAFHERYEEWNTSAAGLRDAAHLRNAAHLRSADLGWPSGLPPVLRPAPGPARAILTARQC